MQLDEYQPLSNLVVKKTFIKRSRFPVVDMHNHLDEEFGGGWIRQPVSKILAVLNDVNVKVFVDLDGGWGEKILQNHLDKLKQKAPETFKMFAGIPWQLWEAYGNNFPDYAAERLREQVGWGAEGLKVWKNFGLQVRDDVGNLVAVDDPRLDIIWETAAELSIPVMIHTGDPTAFFEPLDMQNERFQELSAHPEWHFPSPPFPSFNSLINGLANIVKKHSNTTFIGAHVGCYAENLQWVGKMLDHCPNYYIDIASRIPELGRQPYSARKFIIKYADQILFGLDNGPEKAAYQHSYRFLETDDEYFGHVVGDSIPQGRWQIYGLYLPENVLKKVYFDNARKIFNLDPLPG